MMHHQQSKRSTVLIPIGIGLGLFMTSGCAIKNAARVFAINSVAKHAKPKKLEPCKHHPAPPSSAPAAPVPAMPNPDQQDLP